MKTPQEMHETITREAVRLFALSKKMSTRSSERWYAGMAAGYHLIADMIKADMIGETEEEVNTAR